MARLFRIHFVGAFYHVIARGNQGQKIFREEGDYLVYLKFLSEYKKRFGFCLYGYALMPSPYSSPDRDRRDVPFEADAKPGVIRDVVGYVSLPIPIA